MIRFLLLLVTLLNATQLQAQVLKSESESLDLLCLNTWMIPFLRRKSITRSKLIGRHSSQYDFVMLQEVFNRRQRRIITREINRDDKFYNRYQTTPLFRVNSGLFNLSKYQISKSTFKRFTWCGGAQCWSNKGVLHTRVRLNSGKEIDIYNTHLQPFSSGKFVRQKQIEEIFDFINDTNDGLRSVILAGDFNIHGGGEEYQEIADQLEEFGLYDAWTTVNPNSPGYTWDATINSWSQRLGSKSGKSRLDYIFVKNGSRDKIELLDSRVVFDEPYSLRPGDRRYFLSDHFGVDIKFRIHSTD